MPFKYSKEERLAAFRLLVQTMGDVNHVATETGISPRTLQYWKRQYRLKVTATSGHPFNPEAKYYKDQYRIIRERLFHHLVQTMEQLDQMRDPVLLADLTPNLTRLIDRLAKMEDLIAHDEAIFHIEWVNPETLYTDPDDVDKQDQYRSIFGIR